MLCFDFQDDSDDSDDDDTADLLAELNKIKKERAQDEARKVGQHNSFYWLMGMEIENRPCNVQDLKLLPIIIL